MVNIPEVEFYLLNFKGVKEVLTVHELLKELSVEARRALASKTTDEDILDILAIDENKFVRAAAIANPSTREQTVNEAVSDPEYIVRLAVAKSIKLTETSIQRLLNDEEQGIVNAIKGKI